VKDKSASYINNDSTVSSPPRPLRRRTLAVSASLVTMLAALVFGVLISVTAASTSSNSYSHRAQAFSIGFLCGNIGYGMSNATTWSSPNLNYPNSDNARVLTAQEAFGNALGFVSYTGEGNNSGFLIAAQNESSKLTPDGQTKPATPYYSFVQTNAKSLSAHRSFSACSGTFTLPRVSNAMMDFAGFFTDISSVFSNMAFNPHLICNSATPPAGSSCFNLLGIIGGTSQATATPGNDANGGLIGNLTNSIYFPLLSLVAISVGAWVLYTGIVQRRLREALFGVAWCVAAILLGGALLLNPSLLAQAPLSVSNTLSSCVIGAVSGENCVSGGNTSTPAGNICYLSTKGLNPVKQTPVVVDSLNCQIWKAFLLEPWAQGQFGTSYENLATKGSNLLAPLQTSIAASGVTSQANNFCLNLRTADPVSGMVGGNLELDAPTPDTLTPSAGDNTSCNIGLYALMLKTQAGYGSGGTCLPTTESAGCPLVSQSSEGMSAGLDLRWYNLVLGTYKDSPMFSDFSASASQTNMLSEGFVALLTSAMGSVVIIIISIFAIMYEFIAIIMIAFAPIFFLIGVHPGRGKTILKGFGEIILSNIMKYLASALFLVVTIFLYGGVLGNSTNPGLTLLFVAVLSLALLLYRKEIIELLGRVDMGGKKLSNKLSERVQKAGKRTGNLTLAGLGGAVGSKMAGGTASDGMREQVRRDLRRGKGFVGSATRGFENIGRENLKEVEQVRTNAEAEETKAVEVGRENLGDIYNAEQEYNSAQAEFDSTVLDYETTGAELVEDQDDLVALAETVETMRTALDELVDKELEGEEDKEEYLKHLDFEAQIQATEDLIRQADIQGKPTQGMQVTLDHLNHDNDLIIEDLDNKGSLDRMDQKYNRAMEGDPVQGQLFDDEGNPQELRGISYEAYIELNDRLIVDTGDFNARAEEYSKRGEAIPVVVERVDTARDRLNDLSAKQNALDIQLTESSARKQATGEGLADLSRAAVLRTNRKDGILDTVDEKTNEAVADQQDRYTPVTTVTPEVERHELNARQADRSTLAPPRIIPPSEDRDRPDDDTPPDDGGGDNNNDRGPKGGNGDPLPIPEPRPAPRQVNQDTIPEPRPAPRQVNQDTIPEPRPAPQRVEQELVPEPRPAPRIGEQLSFADPKPTDSSFNEQMDQLNEPEQTSASERSNIHVSPPSGLPTGIPTRPNG
jgi:hypothetical protein